MSNIPNDRLYTEEHEWAKQEGDLVVIGITSRRPAISMLPSVAKWSKSMKPSTPARNW